MPETTPNPPDRQPRSTLPGQAIEKCPQCGYSWEGLPEEGACPECSLRYDTSSRTFDLGRGTPIYTMLAAAVFMAFVIVLRLGTAGSRLFVDEPFSTAIMILSCVWMLVLSLGKWLFRGQSVSVTRDGIFVTYLLIKQLFRWDEIRRVERKSFFAHSHLMLHLKDRRVFRSRRKVISKNPKFPRFAEYVIRERYRQLTADG